MSPTGYSPASDTVRKGASSREQTHRPMRRTSQAERIRQRQHRVYLKLVRGMQDETAWFFTLTKGRDLALTLRRDSWQMLRTRMGQRWSTFQAVTIYEYGQRRGVHLHIVVKGTPGLSVDWLAHVVGLLPDGTRCGGFQPVTDPEGLAAYLTKQITPVQLLDGWPRHFQPASFTHGWCPDWQSRAAWRKQQTDRAA